MFDFSEFFVSSAFAQEAVAAVPDQTQAMMSYIPFVLIFAVFYFLVIRPQQKRLSEQDRMVKSLQKGDRVVTSSGIHGKVAKIDDSEPGQLILEIADGVQIKIDRDNIAGLEVKPEAKPKDAAQDGKENGKK